MGGEVQSAPWPDCEPFHSRPDGTPLPLTRQRNPTPPQTRASPVRERLLPCPIPPSPSPAATVGRHTVPPKAPADRRQPPIYPNSSPDRRVCNFLTPLQCRSRRSIEWIRAKATSPNDVVAYRLSFASLALQECSWYSCVVRQCTIDSQEVCLMRGLSQRDYRGLEPRGSPGCL